MSSEKGFTLIELLVVISIIGMLSSVVLVSLNSVRGKASVAAGKTFATHTKSALYDDALVYFDFDKLDSENFPENFGKSSLSNKVNSSSNTFPIDTTLYNSGKNLLIPSGVTYPLRGVSNDIATAYDSGNFTLSFWFKPVGTTYAPGPTAVGIGDANGLTFFIRFVYSGSTVTSVIVNHNSSSVLLSHAVSIDSSQWVHIAVSAKNAGGSNSVATLYVNGKQVSTSNTFTLSTLSRNTLVVGGNCCGWSAGGYYESIGFFSRTLISANIKDLYDVEKKTLLAKEN